MVYIYSEVASIPTAIARYVLRLLQELTTDTGPVLASDRPQRSVASHRFSVAHLMFCRRQQHFAVNDCVAVHQQRAVIAQPNRLRILCADGPVATRYLKLCTYMRIYTLTQHTYAL